MTTKMLLENIKNDRTSGSTKITEDTCEFIRSALRSGAQFGEVKEALMEVLESHRPMALLHSCIRHFLNGGHPDDFLRKMRKRTETASGLVSQYMKEKGIASVVTMSSSSVVEMALSDFEGRIYIMESRPMMEGTMMAERLVKKGRNAEVVTDAYGISMAAKGKPDAVLVGADALYRGSIINKVGTYALSVAAEKSGLEFIAVLTTDKIFPKDVELSEDEIMQFHEPKEITERTRAVNPYFEDVPVRESMRIFDENGPSNG